VSRLNGKREISIDVRIVAAGNRNLGEEVLAGRFRKDLFYRLNVLRLTIPPLRELRDAGPALLDACLAAFATELGTGTKVLSEEARARLVAYDWPGNIRELQNVIERAVVLAPGAVLELDDDLLRPKLTIRGAPPAVAAAPVHPPSEVGLAETLEEIERAQIVAALQRSGGVVEGPRGAAGVLRMHPNTLRSRMEKLGIRRSDHETS